MAMLIGLHEGNTNLCCFVCERVSRALDRHYRVNQWSRRGKTMVGQKIVAHRALVEKNTVWRKKNVFFKWVVKITYVFFKKWVVTKKACF
jgi:hypothetical protein